MKTYRVGLSVDTIFSNVNVRVLIGALITASTLMFPSKEILGKSSVDFQLGKHDNMFSVWKSKGKSTGVVVFAFPCRGNEPKISLCRKAASPGVRA